jgi:hypothetical protein
VAGNDRGAGQFQRLQHPVRRQLRDIDDDAQVVQLADGGLAERREAVPLDLRPAAGPRGVGIGVVACVHEAEAADAGAVIGLDRLQAVAERIGVQESDHDGALAGLGGGLDVVGREGQHRAVGMALGHRADRRQLGVGVGPGLGVAFRRARALRNEHRQHGGVDLTALQLGQIDLTVTVDGDLVRADPEVERHVGVAVDHQGAGVDRAGVRWGGPGGGGDQQAGGGQGEEVEGTHRAHSAATRSGSAAPAVLRNRQAQMTTQGVVLIVLRNTPRACRIGTTFLEEQVELVRIGDPVVEPVGRALDEPALDLVGDGVRRADEGVLPGGEPPGGLAQGQLFLSRRADDPLGGALVAVQVRCSRFGERLVQGVLLEVVIVERPAQLDQRLFDRARRGSPLRAPAPRRRWRR